MAHFDEIGESGLDQLLTRRLTTPGGSVAPSVAPEIFPGLTLENDRPEWGYLKGEYFWGGFISHGAAVNTNNAYLTNPAGSRVIAVVSRIDALAGSGTIGLYLAPIGSIGTPATIQTGLPRDGRYTAFSGGVFTRRSTCLMQFVDRVLGAEPDFFRSLTTTLSFAEPIIVAPGTYLAIVARTGTATLSYGVQWSERLAQPGEL